MYSQSGNSSQSQEADPLGIVQAAIARMTVAQLDELARMRGLGMAYAQDLDRWARGERLPLAEELAYRRRSRGIIRDFVTVARAIRQIIVLEMELTGRREPDRSRPKRRRAEDQEPAIGAPLHPLRPLQPLRDDLGDPHDHEPVGLAVDWIRAALAIEPPDNDPFVTPASRARKAEAAAEADRDPYDFELRPPTPRRAFRNRPAFPTDAWTLPSEPEMPVSPMPGVVESLEQRPRGPP